MTRFDGKAFVIGPRYDAGRFPSALEKNNLREDIALYLPRPRGLSTGQWKRIGLPS